MSTEKLQARVLGLLRIAPEILRAAQVSAAFRSSLL
jgi:hypothetical protein